MNTEDVVQRPSQGELFKRKFGISKTMARNMKKKGLNYVDPSAKESYREIRKKRKLEERVIQKAKYKANKLKRDKPQTVKNGQNKKSVESNK